MLILIGASIEPISAALASGRVSCYLLACIAWIVDNAVVPKASAGAVTIMSCLTTQIPTSRYDDCMRIRVFQCG